MNIENYLQPYQSYAKKFLLISFFFLFTPQSSQKIFWSLLLKKFFTFPHVLWLEIIFEIFFSSLITPTSSLLSNHVSLIIPQTTLFTPLYSLLLPDTTLINPLTSLSILTTHSSLATPHSSQLCSHSLLLGKYFFNFENFSHIQQPSA